MNQCWTIGTSPADVGHDRRNRQPVEPEWLAAAKAGVTPALMPDFIDLRGASGAEYRFRLWVDGAAHPPVAGNYVVLTEGEAGGLTILLFGVTTDLSSARREGAKVEGLGPTEVFTRRNVARALRTAEHLDLAGAYTRAFVWESV